MFASAYIIIVRKYTIGLMQKDIDQPVWFTFVLDEDFR